ncbi:hypothetical protein VTN00DRAFT_2537 [Thermoascus crustaceus]|uniref:uncharacterized protein n=1 Tax=Thermoascus crustaceus TaxID=5088 RepID=UPI0037425B1C
MTTASIVTFSGLRCTKVRRTAGALISTSTSSSDPPIETSGNQATPISSPIETQVSTASDPAPEPGVKPSSTTTTTSSPSATGQTAPTSLPDASDTAGGTNDGTLTSTSSPLGPVGITSSGDSPQNSSGQPGDGQSQRILRFIIGGALGAFAILTVSCLLWYLLRRRRWRRRSRTPETIDFYATEKSQRDGHEASEMQRLSAPPATSGNVDRKGSQLLDQPAQLEPLSRAAIKNPAVHPPEWLSLDPQQSQLDRKRQSSSSGYGDDLNNRMPSQISDPLFKPEQALEAFSQSRASTSRDPFADPRSAGEPQSTAKQYRLSFPQSAFEGFNFDLPPAETAHPKSPEPQESRDRKAGQTSGHDREESTSSSVIVLPGRSSAGSSLHNVGYEVTASDLARWRQERDTFTRASTRSDPFDLERPSMTTYTITRPFGDDTKWGPVLSTNSNMTIYSPAKEDDK